MNQQTEQELSTFLEHCPCAICGARPATVHAAFMPDPIRQHLYGAPVGETRNFFYGLCAKCLVKGPGYVIPRVEAAAMQDVGRPIWN
jgi:hypothetical protein